MKISLCTPELVGGKVRVSATIALENRAVSGVGEELWLEFPADQESRLSSLADGKVLTGALFVHGFDIPLNDNVIFKKASGVYRERLAALGVELICCRTNIRDWMDRIGWEETHGAALIGTSHLLSGAWETFLVPGSGQFLETWAWGSDWRTDPLLSSDCVEIRNHGSHFWRVEKVRAIAHRKEARDCLRVCWRQVDGLRNCGRCTKCVRTMLTLTAEGVLEQFSVFTGLPGRRQLWSVRFRVWEFDQVEMLARDLEQKDLKRHAFDLRCALRASRALHVLRKLRRR